MKPVGSVMSAPVKHHQTIKVELSVISIQVYRSYGHTY